MIKYHPKFWADGSYQCCRQTEKLAPGCEKYNLFESSKYSFCSMIILCSGCTYQWCSEKVTWFWFWGWLSMAFTLSSTV